MRLTKAIETPLRELSAQLGTWSQQQHQPDDIHLSYVQECLRFWAYTDRTRALWAQLGDNAPERQLEGWYAEMLEVLQFSNTYVAGMPDVSEEAKGEWIHRWQSIKSEVNSLAYDGQVLADRVLLLRRLAITRWWSAIAPRVLGGVLRSRPR